MKKLFSLTTAIIMMLTLAVPAFAAENNLNAELRAAYNNIVSYAEEGRIPLEMTYDEFVSLYDGGSISDFENSFYDVLEPIPNSPVPASGSNAYYYNTGLSCPDEADYSRSNLLDVVERGDIIYEAAGLGGITGHIAIVEDVITDSRGNPEYIRLIEAIDDGVVRSILDDTRYLYRLATVMYVRGASDDDIDNAIDFCIGELGADYELDFQKDTEAGQDGWYCSELVWAAYKNQGIDIEVSGNGEPGVTPRDIKNSSLTIDRDVTFS